MKIATWNVNSLKARLEHVVQWLATEPVDVLCLQELKLRDETFPLDALREAGYAAVFAGQPTYNGVAILWRLESMPSASDVVVNNPLFDDPSRRLISASFDDLRIVCAYMPNGQQVGSEKYEYKLRWMASLRELLASRPGSQAIVLTGDFNVAPDDRDVHDPALWHEKILCSTPERQAFKAFTSLGLHDAFRLFEQPPGIFSWWDYRQLGLQRNAGLRIDHILVDESTRASVERCWVDKAPRKWLKPSDHAPVIAELTRATRLNPPVSRYLSLG